jgi:hypothetical protein
VRSCHSGAGPAWRAVGGAHGRARRGRDRALTEGRRKEGEKGKKEKRKEKRKGNGEIRKKKNKEKGKRKRKEKGFRKLGEILGKLGGRGERDFVGFPGFSDTGVISETAVMARRIGRRDRGMRGIPGEVADNGAGVARGERRWPELWWAVPAGFAARAPREGEGKEDRGFKKIIESF